MTEAELQRLVTDAAELYGWSWCHFRAAQTKRGWRVPVEGPLGRGWLDLVLAQPRTHRLLGLEIKSSTGRVSPEQAAVHEVLRAAGLDVRVVRPADIDDLLGALR